MSEWISKKLSDVTTKIGSGATPRGGSSVYSSIGVALIRSQNVLDNAMKSLDIARISDEAAQSLSGVTVEPGDVLINITGDSIARCAVVDPALLPARVNQHVAILRTSSELDSRFLQRYLVNPSFKDGLIASSSGGTRNALTKAGLGDLVISFPPLPVQRAIAEVLGALDDKIAANTALASTADEWVRAGFDALSVDAFEMKSIGELVSLRRDQAGPASFTGDILYVGLEHVPRRSMWLSEVGSAASVTSQKNRFEPGDILFGKLRPYFHKVVTAPHQGVCSTDILVLKPFESELSGFTLAAIASDAVVRQVTSASEGTRMPRTSWKDLAAVEVPWPGPARATRFGADVVAVRAAVESQLSESRTLAATRDVLLPQLMSGKFRVKDAEKVLEGVL